MRLWNILVALCLILAAGLGLLVLAGGARGLFAPPLEARLVVQDFPVPEEFGIDPQRTAAFLLAQLTRRLDDDVALRLTLKGDAKAKVRDLVLPRLMNEVVVQAMVHEIPELAAVLDLGDVRRSVTGQVTTETDARDVALTMPGALLAEVDGKAAKVTTTSTGMTALSLGDMAAGEVRNVRLWLGAASVGSDLGRTIRVGADKRDRGRVLLWGAQGWFGADMEALRWSRWLVGAVLAGTMLFGLISLLLPLLTGHQARVRGNR